MKEGDFEWKQKCNFSQLNEKSKEAGKVHLIADKLLGNITVSLT
jgi:hypothetical protein